MKEYLGLSLMLLIFIVVVLPLGAFYRLRAYIGAGN